MQLILCKKEKRDDNTPTPSEEKDSAKENRVPLPGVGIKVVTKKNYRGKRGPWKQVAALGWWGQEVTCWGGCCTLLRVSLLWWDLLSPGKRNVHLI